MTDFLMLFKIAYMISNLELVYLGNFLSEAFILHLPTSN